MLRPRLHRKGLLQERLEADLLLETNDIINYINYCVK